jgi:hypothetical protein
MKICANNKTCINLNVGFDDQTIEDVGTIKFLDLQIDINLNWKTHIVHIIPKLSSACFAMRTVSSLMKTNFKIGLLCLLPFHRVVWGIFGGS